MFSPDVRAGGEVGSLGRPRLPSYSPDLPSETLRDPGPCPGAVPAQRRSIRRGDLSKLEIRLLGPPKILVDGEPLSVDTRKAIALLSFLAVEQGLHQREALAGLLWPEYDHEAARGALRRTLSNLRKALGGRFVSVDRQAIGLERADVYADVSTFRTLIERAVGGARAGAVVDVERDLTDAVRLYRGDFMRGFALRDSVEFDEWHVYQSDFFRRLFARALDRLALELHGAGRQDAAIESARRRLALDPLHEPAHRMLMNLYASTARRSDAVRQYRECVAVLERELGVPPVSETTELYQAIRDERLPSQPRREPAAELRVPRGDRPLIGRDTELDRLRRVYEEIDGHVRLVAIEGEAGVGKTRLAEEFLAAVETFGGVTLVAKCFEEERHLPYAPIVDVLRTSIARDGEWLNRLPQPQKIELARLLPDAIDIVSPPSRSDPAAQSRFIGGICRALAEACAGANPGVLFVDDLHWADASSLEVFGWLLRRTAGTPLLVVSAYRNEDVLAAQRLRKQLPATTTIQLGRLAEADVRRLLGAAGLGPDRSSDEVGALLYRETEGLPLFVVEYLASWETAGSTQVVEWNWPQGIRDLLRSRISGAGEIARQVLAAAAVVGRAFHFDTVRQASGRSDEESVAAIEELVGLGLISEVHDDKSEPRYDFRHEKIREFVYEETSQARRRLLHSRAADALIRMALRSPNEGRLWLAIANHCRLAGRDSDAAAYFALAGEHSRDVFANAEAIAAFKSALALGHSEPARIHEAIGDLQTLAGEYGAALVSYETAAALCERDAAAVVEHKLGRVHHRRGDWQSAQSHYRSALEHSKVVVDPAFRSRVLSDWGLSLHHAGDSQNAHRIASEGLMLADESADVGARAQASNVAGVLASGRGEFDSSLAYLEQSRALAEQTNDYTAQVAALNNMALTHRAAGRIEPAVELTRESLRLCERQGDRHREAALHNNLADLLQVSGRRDDAMFHLKRAVAIFAEVGEPGEMEPAIWKLVEW
jgi:DNA-binding SARP family transcriptional activator